MVPEPLLQAFGDAEDAAVDADILTEADDTAVARHFLVEGLVDRLDEVEFWHSA